MKIFSKSQRLSLLFQQYRDEQNIWDIGCDHGKLGLSFSEFESVRNIHLVDSSPSVIECLKKTIKDSDIPKTQKIKCFQIFGQNLKIHSKNNLFYIAGMGGMEILAILDHIIPQLDETSRIVISPHKNLLEVRESLHFNSRIFLDDELLCHEKDQFYQILVLKIDHPEENHHKKVSLFGGDRMWNSEVGRLYAKQQIDFYLKNPASHYQKYVTALKKFFL